MNVLQQLRPLHNRIIVKHLQKRQTGLIVVRENPTLVDFVGDGDNAQHNDNRRVGIVSEVISVGGSVRGVKKGDCIMHSAWNDLPPWLGAPKEYAMIREADVFGHYAGTDYEA